MTWWEWREAPAGDFAVLGDPVSHSRSPQMHAAAYRALGVDYVYRAVRVPLDEFRDAVKHLFSLGYRGLNCTVPLKEAAFDWAVDVDPVGRKCGVVNTIELATRRGTNTDAPAFLTTLDASPPGPVLVLGAGGTARAVVAALESKGFQIRLWNRTPERAVALTRSLGADLEVFARPELLGVKAVVNTTSASLHGEDLPVDWTKADPDLLVYEAAYGPSSFLDVARVFGLRTTDGLPLLVEQGALAITWWTGLVPDRSVMIEAVG